MSINAELQTKAYWDQRYELEAPDEDFDWFRKYEDIKEILHELIPDRSSRILMLGCGNSTLTAEMHADSYTNIVNLDFSPVLIEKMRQRHPNMDWRVMDVRQVKENKDNLGQFDVVIDKGTLDALMAEKGSVWDPSPEVRKNVADEIEGVVSVLNPNRGVFIYVTFAQPHFRRPLLERPGVWEIEQRTLGEDWHYFFFIMRRKSI